MIEDDGGGGENEELKWTSPQRPQSSLQLPPINTIVSSLGEVVESLTDCCSNGSHIDCGSPRTPIDDSDVDENYSSPAEQEYAETDDSESSGGDHQTDRLEGSKDHEETSEDDMDWDNGSQDGESGESEHEMDVDGRCEEEVAEESGELEAAQNYSNRQKTAGVNEGACSKKDEESGSEDENDKDVNIPPSLRHESTYDKLYACFYCQKVMKCKLSRHLLRTHGSEKEVEEIEKTTTGSKERRRSFQAMEKKGAYKHNILVLSKKAGTLLVQKRPTKGKIVKLNDYRCCPNCNGFYIKTSIRRHLKSCVPNEHVSIKEVKQFYANLLYADGNRDDKNITSVLSVMEEDIVSAVVKEDWLIKKHGRIIYEGFNCSKETDVSYRMRLCGRLLLKVREVSGNSSLTMEELIDPKNFDTVIQAVREIGQIAPGVKMKSVPSTTLKMGHELKHCTDILMNQAIREGNIELETRADKFRTLHVREWGFSITKHALKSLAENKSNDPIPFTADVKKVREHILLKMNDMTSRTPRTLTEYRELIRLTLSRIIMFNAKRSGEAAKVTLDNYRSKKLVPPRDDFNLTPMERKLCERLEIMEITGKRGRKVPVLLTPDMVQAIDICLGVRPKYINEGNNFLFAVSKGTRSTAGWNALKQVVAKVDGLEDTSSVTSTKLRKYLATMSQIMDLKENELDSLADHLGHNITVHRQYYRLPSTTIEIAKVGKLLMANERGLDKYSGMKLDQIELSDLEED